MDYYEKKRKANIDLQKWITNDESDSFSQFSRRMAFTYGFDRKVMLKILENSFPELTIKNDKLEKVE